MYVSGLIFLISRATSMPFELGKEKLTTMTSGDSRRTILTATSIVLASPHTLTSASLSRLAQGIVAWMRCHLPEEFSSACSPSRCQLTWCQDCLPGPFPKLFAFSHLIRLLEARQEPDHRWVNFALFGGPIASIPAHARSKRRHPKFLSNHCASQVLRLT